MNSRITVQIEFHGIGRGQALWDLQNTDQKITLYFREAFPDIDLIVTAITDDKEVYIGGRVQERFTGTPYVRIYHTCKDAATLAPILDISKYPGMYRYSIQIIYMNYIPPDRSGHLP